MNYKPQSFDLESAAANSARPVAANDNRFAIISASITDGDGRMTATLYDPADRVSIVTDPMLRETGFTYDPAGNVLTELHGYGSQVQATYATWVWGSDGEKLSVADADGPSHLTQYGYDGFNRLNLTTFPDNSTEQIPSGGYDANGNVLSRIDRAGQSFAFTYDVLNRLKTKVVPAYGSVPANTITYAYDYGGRRTKYSDTVGNIVQLTNDTAGRLTGTTTSIAGGPQSKAATYTLDANANRTELLWPDGYFVGYCYDSLNRMTQATANATDCATGLLATWQYDPFSRRTSLSYGSHASMAYTNYTNAGDLQTLTLNMVGTGNDNVWTLGYTNGHQLTSEAASIASYQWQPSGTGTDAYAAVNVLNQYPSVTPNGQGAQTQSFDGNGNLAGDGTLSFAYDPENHLVTATGGALAAAYAYDPLGRRQQKSGTGLTTTFFLQDGDDEIAEYNSSNVLTNRFVPGPAIDEPIAMVPKTGTTELFYTDHHGSVVATSDASGNLIKGPFTYDPWGNCLAGTTACSALTAGEPFKFTGQYFDSETGCYYYRARYYCPDSLHGGRFLQTDAVGYTSDLDLYTYVRNDPVNRTDPTGMYESCPDQSNCIQSSTYSQQNNKVPNVKLSKHDEQVANQHAGEFRGTNAKQQYIVGDKVENGTNSETNTVPGAAESASSTPPPGATATIHGHPTAGPRTTDGIIDAPTLGDAQPITQGLPNVAVNGQRSAVTEAPQGHLRLRMTQGQMSRHETETMGPRLDQRQEYLQQYFQNQAAGGQ